MKKLLLAHPVPWSVSRLDRGLGFAVHDGEGSHVIGFDRSQLRFWRGVVKAVNLGFESWMFSKRNARVA